MQQVPATSPSRLAFLHLSDIHFPEGEESDVWELDSDLRNELELSVAEIVSDRGRATHVLVTGDIAFSGKEAQYERAARWLERVAELSGCPRTAISTVPGNHDIDWARADGNKPLRLCHESLRATAPGDLDTELEGIVKDVDGGRLIFAPLENYNAFAFHYRCEVKPTAPFWQRPFDLNDGSTLMVRGLTSVLVSDRTDSRGRLLMGASQATLRREPGVTYLTMSHHPPDWLLDHDAVDSLLVERARVQLFGHRHEQRLLRIGDSVRMVAGAVHPARNEHDWIPRFNWVELFVSNTDSHRTLEVCAFPRVWNDERKKFVPDYVEEGAPCRRYSLPLEDWAAPPEVGGGEDEPATDEDQSPVGRVMLDPIAEATYRLAELPFHRRTRLMNDLGLVDDADKTLTEMEVLGKVLDRIEARSLWESVWDEIDRLTNEKSANPFRRG